MTISAPPQLLTEIIASNNPALEFQPSSGSGIAYGDWGSTKALDYAAVDSVQLRDDDGVAEPEEGFLCMLFNSQSDTDSYNLIDLPLANSGHRRQPPKAPGVGRRG